MYVRVTPYRLVRTRKAKSDWLIMGAATYTGESDAKSSFIRILVCVGGRGEDSKGCSQFTDSDR